MKAAVAGGSGGSPYVARKMRRTIGNSVDRTPSARCARNARPGVVVTRTWSLRAASSPRLAVEAENLNYRFEVG